MAEVTMSRAELVQALEQVKGSVAQKNFLPILTHVLVSGDTMLGYDSEVGVRVKLSKSTPVPFNVKATMFLELLKACEAEDVELTIEKDKVRIKCGGHKSTLPQIGEEYPKPNVVVKEGTWCDVPSGFKEAVERAMLGVSEDENNKTLSALYIGGSYVYGGDGKQVVRCTLEADLPPLFLGRRAVGELLRLGNPTRVALAGSVAVFDFKNLLFLARLREGIEGYPAKQFDQMFGKSREVVPVPTGVINALGRLSLLGDESVKACVFEYGDLGLTIKYNSPVASGEEFFPPMPGPWSKKQCLNAVLAIPLLQFSTSWSPGLHERDPIYFSGDTAGFEAMLAQSTP